MGGLEMEFGELVTIPRAAIEPPLAGLISEMGLRRRIRSGEIAAVQIGPYTFLHIDTIRDLAASLRAKAAAE